MSTDAVHNVLSVSLPIRLADGPLAVEPCRLDRVQPRTPRRHSLQAMMRTPPSRFALALCCLIQPRTSWLMCREALSQMRAQTRLPRAARCSHTQARQRVVMCETGRPLTKRTSLSEAPEDASPAVSDSKTP